MKDAPKRKLRLGVLVNPVAGIGGPHALKGSDDRTRTQPLVAASTWDEDGNRAFARGAAFVQALDRAKVILVAPQGVMGEDVVKRATLMGGPVFEVVRIQGWDKDYGATTREDTLGFTRRLRAADVDLIAFIGGDGTALDVATGAEGKVPILGVPSGVKMFSGVFALTPQAAAITCNHLSPGFSTRSVDVVDLDERSYLEGGWIVRAHAVANVPEADALQVGKGGSPEGEESALEDLVAWFQQTQQPNVTYVLGAGATLGAVKAALGGGTPLGIDVWRDGAFVGQDADEARLLETLGESGDARLIVSPTGSQGAVLGRGTAQVTVPVLERIGVENVTIVATPGKLRGIRHLFVDTGDADLDKAFPDYVKVRMDPYTEKLIALKRGTTHG